MSHTADGRREKRVLNAALAVLVIAALLCAPALGGRGSALANGGTVTIPLCLQVAYQGHGASGTERWMLPVTTLIFYAGSSDILAAWTQVTDGYGGYCSEIALPASSVMVDIVAKHSHTLSVKKTNVPLPGPASYINLGTLLEGDADDNDEVALADFSILRTTYGQAFPLYDERADFNIDERISILDFSLLRTNYARSGPQVSGGAATALAAPSAGVTLTLSPSAISMPPGVITAAIDIVLEAGEVAVDGVDVFIDFDPAYLAVSDASGAAASEITPAGAFTTILANSVDNGAGRIDFSAGVLEGAPVTGTVTLARFYVTPLRQSAFGATTVSFSREGARQTEAAAAGEPVLSGVRNASIDVVRARLWLPVIVWNLAMRLP